MEDFGGSFFVAAVVRLPGVLSLGPLALFGLGYFLVVVAVLYDVVSRRRVHKAYIWGGAASVPLRLMISHGRVAGVRAGADRIV